MTYPSLFSTSRFSKHAEDNFGQDPHSVNGPCVKLNINKAFQPIHYVCQPNFSQNMERPKVKMVNTYNV